METNHTADLYARLHDAENKLFNEQQNHREYKYNVGSRHAIVCGSAMGMLHVILWFAKEQDTYETQGIRKVLSFLEFCSELPDAENKLFNEQQNHREYKYNVGSRHAIVCGSAMGMLRVILWFAKEQDTYETQGIRKVLSFLEFCSELPVEMFKTYDEWTDVRAHFDDLYAMYLDDATESSFKVWLDAVNVSKTLHGKG